MLFNLIREKRTKLAMAGIAITKT